MANKQETAYTRFYRKLLQLYPSGFRERFGESMEQTLDDLCNERRERSAGLFSFTLWTSVDTATSIVREHALQITQRSSMSNSITNPRTAAIVGVILTLPIAFILLIAKFNLEPVNGYLKYLFTETGGYRMHVLGLLVLLGCLFLLPVAFLVNILSITRGVRAGYGIMANPFNLMLAAGLFIFIMTLVAGFVVDQYPCWIGVPNCD